MERKHSFILAIAVTCFGSLLTIESPAQEDFPTNNFQEPGFQDLNPKDDKPLIYEGPEGARVVNMQRDSVQAASKVRNGSKKHSADSKEKDALSFNFLYYIIQKYKFSDIVDQ